MRRVTRAFVTILAVAAVLSVVVLVGKRVSKFKKFVQAVGRGQDPTMLSTEDQVAFCRSTGWTIRDLAALGGSMRAAVIARDASTNIEKGGFHASPHCGSVRTFPRRVRRDRAG